MGESKSAEDLIMIRTVLIVCLLLSATLASPVSSASDSIESAESSEESRELVMNRGLLEDLLINTIRDMVINQINNILGITTTTTPAPDCGPLGLICPRINLQI